MNNNKKKLFSAGLYAEGLRRLKMPGIVSAALLSLVAVLFPLVSVLSKMDQPNVICESVYGIKLNPVLVVVFIIVAPVLAWTIFSFLNKRNSSDFFHSLPHTRPCIFISSVLAVITWLAVIIFVSGGLSALMALIFSKYMVIVSGSLIKYMIGCLSASILVVGAVSVAMTITGRPFSNLVVSSLILFFPRFVISMITIAVGERLPIVFGSLFGSLNVESLNIISSIVLGAFGMGSSTTSEVLTSVGSQIYSAVLGILYIVAAIFLFRIRKSETAERSAPNRALQAVYRICVCMTVCSVICSVVFTNVNTVEVYEIAIAYLIAVIVYFLYELITTRKWKNLVSAIPGLAIVAILNGAIYASMFGIYNSEIKFTPSAADIESVSIIAPEMRGDNIYDFNNFAALKTSDVKITDKEAFNAVSDALKDNAGNLEGKKSYEYWSNYTRQGASYSSYSFLINANGKEKKRSIYITPEQEEAIIKAMLSSSEYTKAYTTLPEAEANTIYVGAPIENKEELKNIYDTMKKEVAALPFETWYKRFNDYTGGTSKQYESPYDYITVTTVYNNKIYKVMIPLYTDIMPETTKAYIEALTKANFADLNAILNASPSQDTTTVYNAHAFIWDNENNNYARAYYNGSGGKEDLDFLKEIKRIKADGAPSYGDSFAIFYVETYTDTWETNQYIVKLDENARETWERIFESAEESDYEDMIEYR